MCYFDEAHPILSACLTFLGLNLLHRDKHSGQWSPSVVRYVFVVANLACSLVTTAISVMLIPQMNYTRVFHMAAQFTMTSNVVWLGTETLRQKRCAQLYLSLLGDRFRKESCVVKRFRQYGKRTAHLALLTLAVLLMNTSAVDYTLILVVIVGTQAHIVPTCIDNYLRALVAPVTEVGNSISASITKKYSRNKKVINQGLTQPSITRCNSSQKPEETNSYWVSQSGLDNTIASVEYFMNLTKQFNKGTIMTGRCIMFFARTLITTFMLCSRLLEMAGTNGSAVVGMTIMLMEDVIRFWTTCSAGQKLIDASERLSDQLRTLQALPGLPDSRNAALASLTQRLEKRPCRAEVAGGQYCLGTHCFVAILNTALTYSFIIFQYRPGGDKHDLTTQEVFTKLTD